jgi:hypothetical protein
MTELEPLSSSMAKPGVTVKWFFLPFSWHFLSLSELKARDLPTFDWPSHLAQISFLTHGLDLTCEMHTLSYANRHSSHNENPNLKLNPNIYCNQSYNVIFTRMPFLFLLKNLFWPSQFSKIMFLRLPAQFLFKRKKLYFRLFHFRKGYISWGSLSVIQYYRC